MRVLFVCTENARRSQMAEAFANMLGAEGVEAFSAGSEPAAALDPLTVQSMRELGYDMSAHEPKSLDDLPDLEFDYVVTLGCEDACPMVKARMQVDWDIPDPKGMDREGFRGVRDMIRSRVERLLAAPRAVAD